MERHFVESLLSGARVLAEFGGSESKRLLADFLVGAHALLRAGNLFTMDPSRYRCDSPKLRLL